VIGVRGSVPVRGKTFISSAKRSDRLWGWLIEAPVQWVSEDISAGRKRSVRETDHSAPYALTF
jgi:hypothetical protein